MATPKVYVICDQNCKFESMTKEQILSAIIQAVEGGTIGDVDAGFITSVKTINGQTLRFFYGDQSAYNALSAEDKENLCAVITNDAQLNGILEELQRIAEKADGAVARVDGSVAKTGDTMTGTLQVPFLKISNWNNYPSVSFVPAGSTESAGGIICHNADSQRIMLVSCFNTDQDGEAERFGEYFRFPAPSERNTSAKWYNVLTTKHPVTIEQGGTGATDAARARFNLGVPSFTDIEEGTVIAGKAVEAAHATRAGRAGAADEADNAKNAEKVNDLEIKRDENGFLKANNFSIPTMQGVPQKIDGKKLSAAGYYIGHIVKRGNYNNLITLPLFYYEHGCSHELKMWGTSWEFMYSAFIENDGTLQIIRYHEPTSTELGSGMYVTDEFDLYLQRLA